MNRWLGVLGGGILLASCQAGRELQLTQVDQLEDLRRADVIAFAELLQVEDPWVRVRAARALGRIRNQDGSRELVRALQDEAEVEVAGEMIFALGQLGNVEALPALRDQLKGPEPEVRAKAAEAVGKLDARDAIEVLLSALDDTSSEVRGQALLALVRHTGRRRDPPVQLTAIEAQRLLSGVAAAARGGHPVLSWRAAYALAEIEIEGRRELLRGALGSRHPWVRLFAVRGAERSGSQDFEAELVAVASDDNPHVAAAAIAALGGSTNPAALAELERALVRHGHPGDHHVRAAAVQALTSRATGDPSAAQQQVLAEKIRGALGDDSGLVRRAALRGWCEVAPKAAVVDCQGAARNPEVAHREYAARAAGALAYEDAQRILTPLLKDVEPRVRCAALQSLAGFDDAIEDLGLALSAYLEDADLAVRGTALALLEEPHPAIDLTAIAAAFDASPSSEEAELRVAAVHAAAALTQTERGDGIVGFLKRALQDSSPAVGEAAADVLEQLTGSRPKLPALVTLPSSVGLAPQELNPQPTRNVILHTTRGEIELELFAAEAPRHVKSFLEQAQAGTYDGLTFHRIVTGFVVQGLDPRGDGWGTGDVFLRDEIQSTPYLAGTLGMPNAGPDTGGCQVFMTHVPTPHLDGRYTVFGRVVNGMTVLDSLDLDDRCERVEILRRS